MPEPSILDARLAEIDRRLRLIQSGLEPVPDHPDDARSALEPPDPLHPAPTHPEPAPLRSGWEPSPLRSAPPPAESAVTIDAEVTALAARLRELTAVQERLVAATQDLLVEHTDVLSRAVTTLDVCAGPFADTGSLQEFQRALADLPQVRDVAVREYAGAQRAVLDVHLWPPIS
ncbi:MAG: hypothetical protein ACR2NR_06120 [Solirubrobacteraceae bacterium]